MTGFLEPEWIGGLAAFFTTCAYLPQAAKILVSKDTSAISLGMYVMMSIGLALWLCYGILLEKPSIIAANGVTLLLAVLILAMKIRHH